MLPPVNRATSAVMQRLFVNYLCGCILGTQRRNNRKASHVLFVTKSLVFCYYYSWNIMFIS